MGQLCIAWRFADCLNIYLLRDTMKSDDPWDVILTTYSLWEREAGSDDRMFLKRLPIHYMVLDEGKEESSQ